MAEAAPAALDEKSGILSPNILYFVAISRFVAIYAFYKGFY